MAKLTPEDHRDWLRAMIAPGQQTRDLSTNDEAAIRWALDELGRLRVERDTACRLERERWEKLPDWARGKNDGH
jgi:hypothetical protein